MSLNQAVLYSKVNIQKFLEADIENISLEELRYTNICYWYNNYYGEHNKEYSREDIPEDVLEKIRTKTKKILDKSSKEEIFYFFEYATVCTNLNHYLNWGFDESNCLELYICKKYINKISLKQLDFNNIYPYWVYEKELEGIELKEVIDKKDKIILPYTSVESIFSKYNQGGSLIIKKNNKFFCIDGYIPGLYQPSINYSTYKIDVEELQEYISSIEQVITNFGYSVVNLVSPFCSPPYSNEVEWELDDDYTEEEYRIVEESIYKKNFYKYLNAERKFNYFIFKSFC